MRIRSLLALMIVQFLYPSLNWAQDCLNPNFIRAFAETENCVQSNNLVGCSSFNALMAGGAGLAAALGIKSLSALAMKAKSPISLDESKVNSYFKELPAATKFDAPIAQLKAQIEESSGMQRVALNKKLKALETQRQAVAEYYYSDELSQETVANLKSKGYQTAQIERTQTILKNYKNALASIDENAQQELSINDTQKAILSKRLEKLDAKMRENPEDKTLISERQKLAKIVSSLEDYHTNEAEIESLKQSSREAAAHQLSTFSPAESSELSKAMLKTASASAALVVAFAFGPAIKKSVTWQKCKSELGFKDAADADAFSDFGAIQFSGCQAEVTPESAWKLVLMSPDKRNELFKKSPALCKAFEKTFISQASFLQSRQPEIDFNNTRCESNHISTEVKIRGHVYMQSISLQQHQILYQGSLIEGASLGQLGESETFKMQCGSDLNWGPVYTKNHVWGSVVNVQDRFSSAANAASQSAIAHDTDCQVLSSSQALDRKMLNNIGSCGNLACAVNEQAVAAKMMIPQLLKYCEDQSHSSAKMFNSGTTNVEGTH